MRNSTSLNTERMVRLLLTHPKGETAIDYFIKYPLMLFDRFKGIDGLDSPFPLKIIHLTQKYYAGNRKNNSMITGLSKNETGQIYSLFRELASLYPNLTKM